MRTRLAILILLVVGVAAGDKKTTLKPTFRYEGRVYVIDSIKAHENGGMGVEISPLENGEWYLVQPQPEMGRRIHRQVK